MIPLEIFQQVRQIQIRTRRSVESIFAGGLGQRIIIRGLALGGLSYWLFQETLAAGFSLQYAQSVAFATLIFAQLWHIFDSRSSTTLFRKYPFGNRKTKSSTVGCSTFIETVEPIKDLA